jgi:hypothetical protein
MNEFPEFIGICAHMYTLYDYMQHITVLETL